MRVIKGCWQLSEGHGAGDPRQAVVDLTAFADAGITTFDCADIYTGVEELLGGFREEFENSRGREALEKLRFHTKFVPDLDVLPTIYRQYVERAIDRSLCRLRMEQLDLVQLHWWDLNTPGYVEVAHLLQEQQRLGKIRRLGVTNFDTAHLREIVDSGVDIVSNQVQYSPLDMRPAKQMAAFATERGIQLLCYGTAAGGFMSERYLGSVEPLGDQPNRSLTKYKLVIDDRGGWRKFEDLLTALNLVAHKHGVGIAEISAAFVLQQEAVGGVILGASAKRIGTTRKIGRIVLDENDRRTIRAATDAMPELPGDVYKLERQPGGKHAAIMRYNLNRV